MAVVRGKGGADRHRLDPALKGAWFQLLDSTVLSSRRFQISNINLRPYSVERYPATGYPEVRFWCLQTLVEVGVELDPT